MYNVKDLMMLYTLTSTHVGSGDDLNYIDLPIQRENHTNFPKVEASSLKGSIKRAMGQHEDVYAILGSDTDGETASAVSFSDARLLFFPVKSAKGVFAYATCPFAISRFLSDCKIAGITDFSEKDMSWLSDIKTCMIPCKSAITFNDNKVVLDEYVFQVAVNSNFYKFVEIVKSNLPELIDNFTSRVILINDDEFTYFVTNSTEVVTRIKINNESGTTNDKALFTQENLPSESILYNLLFFSESKISQKKSGNRMSAHEVKNKFEELFACEVFQVGGDMTLGKGLLSKKMWKRRTIK